MAYKRKTGKRSYKKKAKPSSSLIKTIKTVLNKQAELKTFDSKVTAVQVLSSVLSNTVSYNSDFATNLPLFTNTSAAQEGRIGTEIDLRKIEWGGRFRLVGNLIPKVNLRFILVRFNNSNGAQPTVGKIISDNTASVVYNSSIADDTPYQILMDRRITLTNQSSAAMFNEYNVRFTWKTPKSQKRMVKFSGNNISLDYTAVMSGLMRLYWISDQDLGDVAYTSLQSSWQRISYTDL